jgi:hypothetical protein
MSMFSKTETQQVAIAFAAERKAVIKTVKSSIRRRARIKTLDSLVLRMAAVLKGDDKFLAACGLPVVEASQN